MFVNFRCRMYSIYTIRQDRTQLFFKEHFQPIALQELKDWERERNCMKSNTCLLVHHRRSLWNTFSIGVKEKIRVLQLIIDQLVNSFNSHLEKHFNLVLPSQPNSLNPLKIERGNPLPKRLLVSCKNNLVLLIERGNPIERKRNASWKITIDRGNPIERKDCTKCNKIVISKIVMMRISSTLRWTTRTLISTSPVFPMRRWNALKALAFMTWFRESKVIHKKKQFRMISNNINHSIPSATSQKLRLWLLGTLNYARISTWSRSCNARYVLSIAVQELYTAHVDILWQMILPRIESTSQLCLIHSPYRTSTSESTGHTVTGMEKHLDVKITLRRINLQRNVVKRSMTASTTDTSATKPSGRRWLRLDDLKRSSKRWISLQVKTTLTKPLKRKLTYTVAIGGFTQTWHTSIRYQQGINLISKRRCRQCTASSKRRTRRNMQHGHKVPPLLLGNGIQTGGSPILSTHLKDGMTTDNTGQPVT